MKLRTSILSSLLFAVVISSLSEASLLLDLTSPLIDSLSYHRQLQDFGGTNVCVDDTTVNQANFDFFERAAFATDFEPECTCEEVNNAEEIFASLPEPGATGDFQGFLDAFNEALGLLAGNSEWTCENGLAICYDNGNTCGLVTVTDTTNFQGIEGDLTIEDLLGGELAIEEYIDITTTSDVCIIYNAGVTGETCYSSELAGTTGACTLSYNNVDCPCTLEIVDGVQCVTSTCNGESIDTCAGTGIDLDGPFGILQLLASVTPLEFTVGSGDIPTPTDPPTDPPTESPTPPPVPAPTEPPVPAPTDPPVPAPTEPPVPAPTEPPVPAPTEPPVPAPTEPPIPAPTEPPVPAPTEPPIPAPTEPPVPVPTEPPVPPPTEPPVPAPTEPPVPDVTPAPIPPSTSSPVTPTTTQPETATPTSEPVPGNTSSLVCVDGKCTFTRINTDGFAAYPCSQAPSMYPTPLVYNENESDSNVGGVNRNLGAYPDVTTASPSIVCSDNTLAPWTDPENQDALSETVAITRDYQGGIFNALDPNDLYYSYNAPSGTEWALLPEGQTFDDVRCSLIFGNWIENFAMFDASSMIGKPGVVHLIEEDVYYNIMFTDWTPGDDYNFGGVPEGPKPSYSGGEPGGGFQYIRDEFPFSTADLPECPVCSTATTNPKTITGPIDDSFVTVEVEGVTPENSTVTILNVAQDDDPKCNRRRGDDGTMVVRPNARDINGTSVMLRRTRSLGLGSPYWYTIRFMAETEGGTCKGETRVCVPLPGFTCDDYLPGYDATINQICLG